MSCSVCNGGGVLSLGTAPCPQCKGTGNSTSDHEILIILLMSVIVSDDDDEEHLREDILEILRDHGREDLIKEAEEALEDRDEPGGDDGDPT